MYSMLGGRLRVRGPLACTPLGLVVLTVAALGAAPIAVGRAGAQGATARPMSIEDMMAIRTVGAAAISPDGRLAVYTVSAWESSRGPRGGSDSQRGGPGATGAPGSDTAAGDRHEFRSHLWLVRTDGSEPERQLTFSDHGESQPAWSPDGSRLAFLSARGTTAPGDESTGAKPQLYILRLDGGEAERVSDVQEGAGAFAWSPDGKRVAFLSVDSLPHARDAARRRRDDAEVFEGNERLSHVWLVDLATRHASELVHTTEYTVRGAPTWSPDGTRLAYLTSPTTFLRDERRAAFIVTATGAGAGRVERLDAGGDIQQTPVWSPDGRLLALTTLAPAHHVMPDSMFEREINNSHLVLFDVATHGARDLASAEFDNSPGALTWAPDGHALYFTAGTRVWSSIFRYDLRTGHYTQLTHERLVRGVSLSTDGRRAAMTIDSPDEPPEVYSSDNTFAAPRRLTHTNPQLSGIALGRSEVIRWRSTDGQEVEGVLLEPVGYRPGQRYPLLVEVHGGPTGAHTAGFKASWGSPGQYWAGKGWAVLYPNPRGSTNYGETFLRGNIPDWGGGDYRDIMRGVDALIERGVADADRLAVSGWSYGGYMTSWIVTQTSRFKAAMEGAGLTDLVSMYGTTDIPQYIGAFFHGNPTRETLDVYWQRSPLRYVDSVRTPLLILHGGSDQRVPIGQPMEYFRALKDRGKTVQLVFYPREGHGLSEYYHQVDKIRREYDWIARYTMGSRAAERTTQ